MKSHAPLPKQRLSQSAFTLIELMVVVAILAILAGVSIPLAKIAGDASKSARSRDNLDTIGTVLTAYATEHDNRLPPVESDEELDWSDVTFDVEMDTDDVESLPFWVKELILYGTESETDLSVKTFGCPGLKWTDGGDERIPEEDILLAYGATEALYGHDDDGQLDNTLPRSILKFENKAQTIMIVETKQNGTEPMSYGDIPWSDAKRDLSRPSHSDSRVLDFRFKKAFNALMADGSVSSFRHKNRRDVEEPHWTGEEYDRIR